MISLRLILVCLLLFPFLSFSQATSPFVAYDYKSDPKYNNELAELKRMEKKDPSLKNTYSLADLSYYYKDWETAIDYFEKLIKFSPTAENYLKLSAAAARKSLEVSRVFSVKYVIKARKAILKAYEINPKNIEILKLLIKLYSEIPPILGGDSVFAKKKAKELFEIDQIEGLIIMGYLNEIDENVEDAKLKYEAAFDFLKQKAEPLEIYFQENDRDLVFEVGDIAARHSINYELGIAALTFYADSYQFMDNYPLERVYFNLSRIYFDKQDLKRSRELLNKALNVNPKFKLALDFKKKHRL